MADDCSLQVVGVLPKHYKDHYISLLFQMYLHHVTVT